MTTISRGYADALEPAPEWTAGSSLVRRLTQRAGQAWCGLRHGHDHVLLYEPSRVFLRCTTCEQESPGWTTGEKRYRLTYEGDKRRRLVRLSRLPFRRAA